MSSGDHVLKRAKRNSHVFCTSKRRRRKGNTQNFQTEKKKILAASDLGSWYEQEQQWPELLESEKEGQSTPR